MSEEMPMPQPTEEHTMLTATAGTWNVDCSYFMDPSGEPMKTKAKETVETVGQFWTTSKFESDFMGMPFVGSATLGYDTHDNKFVGTWIDCMSTVLFNYEGQYDAATKQLNMKGRGMMPPFGGVCDYRMSMTFGDGDGHQFDMYVTPPGAPEMQMFHYEYTRA